MKYLALFAVLTLSLTPLAAKEPPKKELSLKAKKMIAKAEKSFQSQVVKMQKKCGPKINATIDWQSFAPHFDKPKGSPALYFALHCKRIVSDVKILCRKHKEEVLSKIENISCVLDEGTAQKAPSLKIDKKTLQIGYYVGNKKVNHTIKEFLGNNL